MKEHFILFVVLIGCCHCKDSFENQNNPVSYHELLSNSKDQLIDDGVWVMWNTTMSGVPNSAVYGGYDLYGANYVIRADHTTPDGIYAGKIIGKYNPWLRIAYVGDKSQEFKKIRFEILTHERCIWTEKGDQRPKIPGSNGYNICRIEADSEEYLTPGKLDSDGRWCTVSYDGTEIFSSNYQVLSKTC